MVLPATPFQYSLTVEGEYVVKMRLDPAKVSPAAYHAMLGLESFVSKSLKLDNRAHSDNRKPEGCSDCAATVPVPSARMNESTIVTEVRSKGWDERKNTMAIESNCDEVIPTYNESYYEERASEEEIYLEETEEELRSKLISDMPQDDHPTPAPDTAFESYREAQARLFQE